MRMLVGLASLFSISLGAMECVIPENVEEYNYVAKENSKDWINKNIETDSFVLAISWSPAYCEGSNKTTGHQCGPKNKGKFGLIVHGLWGQSEHAEGNFKKHPRNCLDAPEISVSTLKQHLCMMPGVKLIQKEWEKHGTCDFSTPEEYLDKTRDLFTNLTIPSIEETKKVEYESWKKIADWFASHNKALKMEREHIFVQMKDRRLKEIRVCYNKSYHLKQCDL